MNRKLSGRAGITGSSVLAVLLLASCGAPSLTMGEAEVKVSKDVIADLDAGWEAHRATQPASNIDGDSGCFVAASEGEMTGSAFCGPVRYLGQDATGWDEIRLDTVESDGKTTLSPRGAHNVGPLEAGIELIRHDGREADPGQQISEPDAPHIAEALTVFITDENLASDREQEVKLPRGELVVSAAAVRERAGGASDRTAAPQGHEMASVSFTADDLENKAAGPGGTKLSFTVDGTSYPVAEPGEGGTFSIAVPEGSKVTFDAEFDGVTQTVGVPDLALDAGDASALYAPEWDGEGIQMKATEDSSWVNVWTARYAHHDWSLFTPGWAGKDEVWVLATAQMGTLPDEPAPQKSEGMEVLSAVMTTADGTELELDGVEATWWGSANAWRIEALYKAPADLEGVTWNVTARDGGGRGYTSGPLVLGAAKD